MLRRKVHWTIPGIVRLAALLKLLLQRPLCCALACSSYTCVVNSEAELHLVFVFCVVSVVAWRVVLHAGG
jgi:hypothetical protein